MERRNFFKLLSISPAALLIKPKKKFTRDKLIINNMEMGIIHKVSFDEYFNSSHKMIILRTPFNKFDSWPKIIKGGK